MLDQITENERNILLKTIKKTNEKEYIEYMFEHKDVDGLSDCLSKDYRSALTSLRGKLGEILVFKDICRKQVYYTRSFLQFLS